MAGVERAQVEQWVARYEELWRSPGTGGLAEIFAPHATYLVSPWATPIGGLAAIAEFWDSGRSGADEAFTMTTEVVAVDADVAVVRVAVDYGDPGHERWRDLWVIRYDDAGRCVAFEEWPFAPGQPDGQG